MKARQQIAASNIKSGDVVYANQNGAVAAMPPITDSVPVVEIVEAKKGVEAVEPGTPSVELKLGKIEIPLGPLPGYIKRRVDIGRMSREQSERLGEITSGLQFKQAKLKNGTLVRSELHAVRWLLENLDAGKP